MKKHEEDVLTLMNHDGMTYDGVSFARLEGISSQVVHYHGIGRNNLSACTACDSIASLRQLQILTLASSALISFQSLGSKFDGGKEDLPSFDDSGLTCPKSATVGWLLVD